MSQSTNIPGMEEKENIVEHNERIGSGFVPALDIEEGLKHRRANTQLDDAADLIAQAGPIEITPADRKRVLRQIDLWVCVPMCIVYTLQNLDKNTVSYGAVFSLQAETGLVGTQYSWLTSVVYVTQFVFQPLSSYALVVFPVKYWVMFNMISWSIVTVCTAAATNFTGLVIARILLGMFEATILPSFVLITQMWWTRREQSYRTIAYQISVSFASLVGPLMAYGIGHATNGIRAYQGIFLFLGSVSLGFAPLIWYMLPNSPTTAKFLRKGNDRIIAIARLRENNTGTKASKWKWEQFWEAMKDPKTWMWTLMFFCCTLPSAAIGAFGGLITQGFGFDSFTTILMQMPTGAIGIIILLISIYLTNWIRIRYLIIATICLPAIAGACGLIYVARTNVRGLMACYYVCYFFATLQPLLYSWANLNAAGTTKRVVTTAMLFAGQCVGNIIGPQLYFAREAPYYHTGLYCDIAAWSCLCLLCIIMGLYLQHLNRKQKARRIALGLPADLEDMSTMTSEEADAYRIALTERLTAQGSNEAALYANSFDDMTDFQNPMFIYVC